MILGSSRSSHNIPKEVYRLAQEESFKICCKICQKHIGYAFVPDQNHTICRKCGISSLSEKR